MTPEEVEQFRARQRAFRRERDSGERVLQKIADIGGKMRSDERRRERERAMATERRGADAVLKEVEALAPLVEGALRRKSQRPTRVAARMVKK